MEHLLLALNCSDASVLSAAQCLRSKSVAELLNAEKKWEQGLLMKIKLLPSKRDVMQLLVPWSPVVDENFVMNSVPTGSTLEVSSIRKVKKFYLEVERS